MTADATQCTRGLGECLALASFQGLIVIIVCFGAAVALLMLIVVALRKRSELPPSQRIEHVVFHEDPSTVTLNRAMAARELLDVKSRLHPLEDDDPFAILEVIENRGRITGGQRYLGRERGTDR